MVMILLMAGLCIYMSLLVAIYKTKFNNQMGLLAAPMLIIRQKLD